MESTKWKLILFEWVKKTELVEVLGSLEHIDLNLFFKKFKVKLDVSDPDLNDDPKLFLSEHFPNYDVLVDETSNISSQDSMYIFSLVLYYSCVLRVNEFFQHACQSLDAQYQPFVFKFFSFLKQAQEDKTQITKEFLRNAIKEAVPTSPNLRFINCIPLTTPVKSPSSTKKSCIYEKTKELQRTKAMLETEQYERNLLETEAKQNEKRFQSLLKEQKLLKQELHRLQNEQTMKLDTENLSPNKELRDEQLRGKMKREIETREEIIFNLRCEIDVLTAKNDKSASRMIFVEQELKDCRRRYGELEIIADDFKQEIEERDIEIQSLGETINELKMIINENRNSSKKGLHDVSSDCLNFSFSTINTVNSSSESGENLGQSVIDVQLKEKIAEIAELKELLSTITIEKEELKTNLMSQEENISTLQKELKEKEFSHEMLCNDIQLSMTSVETLKSEMTEMTKQFKDQLQLNSTMYDEKLCEMDKKMSDMKTSLDEKSENVKQLEIQIANKEKLLTDLNMTFDDLKNRKSELELELNDKNEAFEKILENVKENEKLIEELQFEITSQRSEIEQKAEILSQLESKVEEISRDKEESELKINNALSQLEFDLSAKNQAYELMDRKVKENQELIDKLQSENASQKSLIDEQAENVSQLEAKVQTVTDDKEAIEMKFNSTKSELESELNEKIESLDMMTGNVEEKQKLIKELQREFRLQKSEVDGIFINLSELKSNFEEVSKEKEAIEKQLGKEKSDLESELAARNQAYELINNKVKEDEELIEKLQLEISSQHSLINDQIVKISEIEAKVQAATEDKKAIEIQFADERSKLESELAAKTQAYDMMTENEKENQELIEKLQSEINSQKLVISEQTENVSQLKIEVQSVADDKKTIEMQLNSTKSELESELKQKIESLEMLTERVKEKKELIEKLQSEIISHKLMAEEKDAVVSQIEVKVNEISAEKEAVEMNFNNAKSELEAELTAKNQAYDFMIQNVNEKEEQIEKLQSEINFQKSEDEEKSKILSELEVKLEKSEEEKSENDMKNQTKINDLMADLCLKEALVVEEVERLKTKLSNADECNNEMESRLSEWEKKFTDLDSQYIETLASTDKLSNEIFELKRNLDEAEKYKIECEALKEEFNKVTSQLKENSANHEKIVEEIQKKIVALQTERNELEKKVTQLEAELSTKYDLESQIQLKSTEIDDLNNRLTIAQNENKEMLTTTENLLKKFENSENNLLELREANVNQSKVLKAEMEELKLKFENKIEDMTFNNVQQSEESQRVIESLQLKLFSTETSHNETVEALDEERSARRKLEAELQSEKENSKSASELKDQQLETLNDELQQIKSINEALREDVNSSTKKIAILTAEIDEMKSIRESYEKQINELNSINETLKISKNESEENSSQLKEQLEYNIAITAAFETQARELTDEKEKLNAKLSSLEIQSKESQSLLNEKSSTIDEMITNIDGLKVRHREEINDLERQMEEKVQSYQGIDKKVQELLKKLENHKDLEQKVAELNERHETEVALNDKIQEEIKIFSAKNMHLKAEVGKLKAESEKKVEAVRLESEEKLEKIKQKCNDIYNQGITANTNKFEKKLEDLTKKLESYQQRIEELSVERMNLKEYEKKYLHVMRENEALRSNIRFMEINGGMQSRASIGMSRPPSTMTHLNGANFKGEDEVGEEFNNMYLDHLKSGESQLSIDKIYKAEEIQHRNSMVPKHMRGSYAMCSIDDQNMTERELRDGGEYLDDSKATLLHKDQKKKMPSYSRPGPPTPSKQGGNRLSIGGANDIFYKPILQDATNKENIGKQTPTNKFRSFFSRSNDELSPATPPTSRSRKLLKKSEREDDDDDDEDKVKTEREAKWREKRFDQFNRNRSCSVSETDFSLDGDDSVEETTAQDDDEENILEDDNDETLVPKHGRKLNDSLQSVRDHEDWINQRHVKRSKNFNNNRRKSSEGKMKDKSLSMGRFSDENDKFNSCSSLRSEDSATPKKSFNVNYINTHEALVNRMSDYYVAPPPRSLSNERKNASSDNSEICKVRYIAFGFGLALLLGYIFRNEFK